MRMTSKTALSPGRTQAGFTLLEVLVAVMILGLSITALLQQFALALRAGGTAQDVTRGVMHAGEKLEELKTARELTEGTESGSFEDGYEWETRIAPYTVETQNDEESYENLKHEMFQLVATVTWKVGVRQKQVELVTLKTVRKKEWD